MMTWKEGLWSMHYAQIGVFTAKVQRDGGGWFFEIGDTRSKARWGSVDEAKEAACRIGRKWLQSAADQCNETP